LHLQNTPKETDFLRLHIAIFLNAISNDSFSTIQFKIELLVHEIAIPNPNTPLKSCEEFQENMKEKILHMLEVLRFACVCCHYLVQ
jgi:hypothetical protein